MFGLVFILCFGAAVVALSLALPHAARLAQRRFRSDPYPRLEWCTNATLQLQRLAHEELGLGDWAHADGPVPFTRGLARLAPLDLSDEKHPCLMVPTTTPTTPTTTTTTGEDKTEGPVVAEEATETPSHAESDDVLRNESEQVHRPVQET